MRAGIAFLVCALPAAVPVFAARLPDVEGIVQRSVAANQADFRAQPGYSFFERDWKGKVAKTYEVRMILGSDYHRLVAVNGKPLSPAGQQEEDRKLREEIARRRSESKEEHARRIAKYEQGRARDNAMMQELVKAFRFRFTGEADLDGFHCYVLKATPRPGYQPPNRDTQVLPGMEGRLWIDEKSFQWVKVEAKVVRPVSIEGFLARVEPGTRFELEKMPVDNGIWLPKHFAMKSSARVLYLFSRQSQEDDTFFNYRRAAPVETGPPR